MSSRSKKKSSYKSNKKEYTKVHTPEKSGAAAKNKINNVVTDPVLAADPVYQNVSKFRSLVPITDQDFQELIKKEEKYSKLCSLLQSEVPDDFVEAIQTAESFINYRDSGSRITTAARKMVTQMQQQILDAGSAQSGDIAAEYEDLRNEIINYYQSEYIARCAELVAKYEKKLEDQRTKLEAKYQESLKVHNADQYSQKEGTSQKAKLYSELTMVLHDYALRKGMEEKHQKIIDDFVEAQNILLETKNHLIDSYKKDRERYRIKLELSEKNVAKLQKQIEDYEQQINTLTKKKNKWF